ncbi:Major intracellular serine protease precursor, putative [Perkinsus marinus ATCC 50983]|uniref:subtilisin n=1 Tax=Perkinsus marinus (strain ATCC 50983 / TXsc) TaxID=423536 RepID=C5L267_PERM5|nr:Major intracellular serine protease precursor, putative [Perkinsus marinus ATCC 50983]EER09168.1 Major intracellular serine protease precursor, putative [Perkinsus marinus ATCC 50983]|eukprot:XP_002777352.1 Major intracellular serine protease precursor, putative [Perkinsus marinus ATCC 50983]
MHVALLPFLHLMGAMILSHLPGVFSAAQGAAVVVIEDNRGKQVPIKEAFRRTSRDVTEGKGRAHHSVEELSRLWECFGESADSALVTNLEITGIEIVSTGVPGCLVSDEEICDFVVSLSHYEYYREVACTVNSHSWMTSQISEMPGATSFHVGVPRMKSRVNALVYPPDDPIFSRQVELFEALRIEETWKAVRDSGLQRREPIVSLLDTGIKAEHPEFAGRLLKEIDLTGLHGENGTDLHGHGTAMAGIIAANSNNGEGISGIADKVKIRSIRMSINGRGITAVQLVRAWEAVLACGDSDIIVYAYAGGVCRRSASICSRVLKKAVKKGLLVLVSSSNSDEVDSAGEIEQPCSQANGIPGVLCVTSTYVDNPMTLVYGASKLATLAVPSSDVWFPTPEREGSEWLYSKNSGSSVATAIVGGIAALVTSLGHFDLADVERILLNSTKGRAKTDKDEMLYGVLDPYFAI